VRREPAVGPHLVLEIEALAPDPSDPDADLDLFAEGDRRAEVDLEPRENQTLLRVPAGADGLEIGEARRLHVRREDRIVDVIHSVEVVESDHLAVHEVVAVHRPDGIDGSMPGEKTKEAVFAQPDWLRRATADARLPDGRIVFTGCGTSFHAAQTGGQAVEALDASISPPDADVLVCVSHEGTTRMTRAAAAAFPGTTVAVTVVEDSPIAAACDEVVAMPGPPEESYCHTRGYTCAVAALAALRGEDIAWLPSAVEDALRQDVGEPPAGRVLVTGSGSAWATAQEGVLKLREGAYLPAEAHHTEELLHGHLAAVDKTVRAYVLDGPRAADAVRALETLGCETTLVPTRHPVVDIVFFQLLMLAAAEARGTNPDLIRREDERWQRARAAYD
jgi:glutamine---fructose-6-phosphate transaminase (isomerizing)